MLSVVNYSGTTLSLHTLKTTWSVHIKEVSLFRRLFSILLYVAGTASIVLIRRPDSNLKVLNGDVPLYSIKSYSTAGNLACSNPIGASIILLPGWKVLQVCACGHGAAFSSFGNCMWLLLDHTQVTMSMVKHEKRQWISTLHKVCNRLQ